MAVPPSNDALLKLFLTRTGKEVKRRKPKLYVASKELTALVIFVIFELSMLKFTLLKLILLLGMSLIITGCAHDARVF